MAKANITHDITIEDSGSGTPKKGFMLYRENSKRQFVVQDYQTIAPRTLTTQEIDAAQLPPEIELSWFQDRWELGQGGINHRDYPRMLASGSKVDTSTEGILQLAKELNATAVDTAPSSHIPAGFAAYQNSEVWAFVGDEAYKWDYTGKDWADIQATSTGKIATGEIVRNGLNFAAGTYCPVWTAATDAPSRAIKKASAGDSWADMGTDAADASFKYHEANATNYFAAHWGSTKENQLCYTTDPSAADITWTTETVGQANAPITGIVRDGDTILVLKINGVWVRYNDGTNENLTPEMERQQHPDNFKGAYNWNSHVILPLGGSGMLQLYQGRLEDISLKNYLPEQTHLHGRVCAVAGDPLSLFLLVLDSSTTVLKYYLVMGKWTEYQGKIDFRWHEVAEVTYVTGTDGDHATLFAEGIPSGTNYHHRIWVGVQSTGSNLLPYFYTVSDTDVEDVYTNDTDAEGVTVLWDANLPKVDKLFSKIDFTTVNLGVTAGTHNQVAVKYRVDGGSWTYVTGTGSTSTLTTSPQTLTFDDEITGKTIELQFLPQRKTTSDGTSPQIKDYTVRAALRPTAIKSIPLRLYLADNQMLLNGAKQSSSKGDLSQLTTWNTGAAEVTMIDPSGTSRDVVFLPGMMRVTEVARLRKKRPEYVVDVVLAEA